MPDQIEDSPARNAMTEPATGEAVAPSPPIECREADELLSAIATVAALAGVAFNVQNSPILLTAATGPRITQQDRDRLNAAIQDLVEKQGTFREIYVAAQNDPECAGLWLNVMEIVRVFLPKLVLVL